ncbi:gas vesicle protein [Streptomyces sp. TX20-6-3]|uniref:gas vesicle protein n=1 Tax=Streptomyces sp. TX20-6-3 TaxID=3028705 RepID=UPI0029B86905|nr:gas vesicle protein [Streptomyces sp. TX20-6-3]MDX2560873.1 gas vesicle protein [Streptomyces sp. TX20-6-3]
MSDPLPDRFGAAPSRALPTPYGPSSSANLADILERVLDKGIVIAGDIRINLLDIELLTIKLRILVASVDKAKEMGIDWWEHDPSLSSKHTGGRLEEENRRLRAELDALRRDALTADAPEAPPYGGRGSAHERATSRRASEPESGSGSESGSDEDLGPEEDLEPDDPDQDLDDRTPPRRGAARRRRGT